ncbi:wolframin [Copidosoma floridanum]|uniref:wolframin n=1 Tax=Copidosoma floridanum TaxID=29053 RepID=UPI000C6F7191|nr:wolframin [Copidosoma floridanum]XP_023248614.1 wolframin [Copidosoma floridanum]
MAGVVPLSGKSGRKQWTLHDGPKGSLRRLRSQLAEDGCPESQVVLAKQLLDECCELDVDKEENAKLGVYWLTKASEQGNLEATDMLCKCLASGRGITEQNYYDVKSCLDMSQDEKLARRAAREMFTNLSNGEEFITTEQLQRCMRNLVFPSTSNDNKFRYVNGKSHLQRSLTGDSCDQDSQSEDDSTQDESYKEKEKIEEIPPDWSEHQGEKISEAALVSAAASYARGALPVVSRVICLVEPAQMDLDAVPLLQRPFVHPLASLKRFYIWLVETLGHRNLPLRKIFFTSHLHTLLLILLHALLGAESVVLFVPLAFYYLSFVVMILATFQILQRKRELSDLRVWSRLFLSYSGGSLNPEEAEYQYCRNNIKPYAHFFLALLLNLMLFPIVATQWTPQSEFTVIALALTIVTLLNFAWRDGSSRFPDLLALFSFGVNVLAKYPYEMDEVVAETWRFLDIKVPTFASYVVGNGIEFCLNFRVVFYLLIPAVFVKMAARDNWRGTYKSLIPHCVSLSWWQLAVLSSQSATWYGLIRGALALVGMVLFLPIVGLASIVLPIVAAVKYLSESDLVMRIGMTVTLGGIPFLASWYSRKTRTSRRLNWIITCMQITFGTIGGAFLLWPMLIGYNDVTDIKTNPFEVISSDLSWEQYQNYCHQPAWEETASKAQIQVQCAQLEGVSISWEGYITNIRVKSIRNNLALVLDQLPDVMANPLRCAFGEPHTDDCNKYTNELRKLNCKTNLNVRRKKSRCHLFAWNQHEFEISVKMKSGIWVSNAQVHLLGDNSFANFSLNIYPGDKIWFTGTLSNLGLESESLLGGSGPHVMLQEAGCHVCHAIDLKSYKRQSYTIGVNQIARGVYLGSKMVLNFLFNPIVIFK